MSSNSSRLFWQMLCLLVLLALWEALCRLAIVPHSVSAPSAILVYLATHGSVLAYHIPVTVIASFAGLGAAICAGLAIGCAMFLWPRSATAFTSISVVASSIPLIALTPLFIAFIGSGNPTRSLIAALASFFPLVIALAQGSRSMDPDIIDVFRLSNAGRWTIFAHYGLPASLPFLFAGLKIAAPSAVLAVVVAEWAGADRGLGLLIVQSMYASDAVQTWAAIVCCCLLALGTYGLVVVCEKLVAYGRTGEVAL